VRHRTDNSQQARGTTSGRNEKLYFRSRSGRSAAR